MGTRKALAVAGVSAFVGALIPAFGFLRMMADNNNNGELYDTVTGQWDVEYALKAATVFYEPSFLLIFVLALALTRLWSDRTAHNAW